MVKSYSDLKEKSLGMVAFFETSNGYPQCYGVTGGNWDGQGISHGVLQYNFGQSSLQPLWIYLDTYENDLCRTTFGTDYAEWAAILDDTLVNQIAWGESISDSATGKHSVVEPWKTYFMNLGTSQPSIDKQIEMSAAWRVNGEKWFKNLGLYSRRGYALLFDIAVQMNRLLPLNLIWNEFQQIDPTGKTKAQIEAEKLTIIVNYCAYEQNKISDPSIQQIVYNRKIAIVNGTSAQGFDITNYDLEYEYALKGDILSG